MVGNKKNFNRYFEYIYIYKFYIIQYIILYDIMQFPEIDYVVEFLPVFT